MLLAVAHGLNPAPAVLAERSNDVRSAVEEEASGSSLVGRDGDVVRLVVGELESHLEVGIGGVLA